MLAEKILAVLGAVFSLGVVYLFSTSQISSFDLIFVDLFPLPGLYFLEILALCLASTALILKPSQSKSPWLNFLPWLCAGVLLAFVILGAWTIGFYLIPAMLAYLIAGILSAVRNKNHLSSHFYVFVMAGLLQAGLILLLVILQ